MAASVAQSQTLSGSGLWWIKGTADEPLFFSFFIELALSLPQVQGSDLCLSFLPDSRPWGPWNSFSLDLQ